MLTFTRTLTLRSKDIENMAKFKIDENEYESDNLTDVQKRVVALYQRAVKEEADAVATLEIARAARLEVGRKLKELVIEAEQAKATKQ